MFDYVYGILHDPVYCDKYEQYLCRDFPRVPVINDKNMMDEQDGFFVSEKLFREYVSVGEQLRKLHLLQVKVSADIAIEPNTAEDMIIESVKYKNGVLHINKNKRLLGISPSVWKYQIGGYQVLDKWFKEHKGEALSITAFTHIENVIGALQETIRLKEYLRNLHV